ncbi:MAG: RidA family protein, partial [Chloroflexi bacterium]|nr:RidA family protein [Chloroflexota bacterium]
MPKQIILPAGVHLPGRYSQAVRAGDTVYVAGQVARDAQGNTVGKGDIHAQLAQVYQNLQATLAAAGTSLSGVVKLNTYITSLDFLEAVREAMVRHFPVQPPASTLV